MAGSATDSGLRLDAKRHFGDDAAPAKLEPAQPSAEREMVELLLGFAISTA